MEQTLTRLSRGERAPDFVLPSLDGTLTPFYAKAGGTPTLLIFSDSDRIDEIRCLSEKLINKDSSLQFSLLAILESDLPLAQSAVSENQIDFPVFLDTQGKIKTAYRLVDSNRDVIFLLDCNLRVLT